MADFTEVEKAELLDVLREIATYLGTLAAVLEGLTDPVNVRVRGFDPSNTTIGDGWVALQRELAGLKEDALRGR